MNAKKELIESIDYDFDNIELKELEIEKLEEIEELDEDEKKKLDVICGGEWTKYWIQYIDSIQDCDLYENMDLGDLARHFVDEGLYWDMRDNSLGMYIDYKSLGEDLWIDYTEHNGDIYRLG